MTEAAGRMLILEFMKFRSSLLLTGIDLVHTND